MIEKITIKCGKNTIELTENEARELFADLDRLYGPKEAPYIPLMPYPPTLPMQPPDPYLGRWSVTCDTNSTLIGEH